MTQPGTFQRVRTKAGWHLVLRAANHEPVIVGEPLTDPDSVVTALAAVIRTSVHLIGFHVGELEEDLIRHAAFHALIDVDERTQETT